MTEPARLSLAASRDLDAEPARQEAIDFARHLARRRARAMMREHLNDSAPRNI